MKAQLITAGVILAAMLLIGYAVPAHSRHHPINTTLERRLDTLIGFQIWSARLDQEDVDIQLRKTSDDKR